VPRRTLEYRDELHVTKPVPLGQGDPGPFELSVYPCPAFHELGRRLGRPDPSARRGGEALLYLGPVHHQLDFDPSAKREIDAWLDAPKCSFGPIHVGDFDDGLELPLLARFLYDPARGLVELRIVLRQPLLGSRTVTPTLWSLGSDGCTRT